MEARHRRKVSPNYIGQRASSRTKGNCRVACALRFAPPAAECYAVNVQLNYYVAQAHRRALGEARSLYPVVWASNSSGDTRANIQ